MAALLSESPVARVMPLVKAARMQRNMPGGARRRVRVLGGFMRAQGVKALCVVAGATVLLCSVAFAQDPKPGKLKITVVPKQAYTFLDGKAIGPGNRTIKLEVGSHHMIVANYGYKFVEKDISIDSDKTLP